MERLLTKQDVCRLLGITARTLDRWRAAGLLRSFKRGGVVRFKETDLSEFIAKQTKGVQR